MQDFITFFFKIMNLFLYIFSTWSHWRHFLSTSFLFMSYAFTLLFLLYFTTYYSARLLTSFFLLMICYSSDHEMPEYKSIIVWLSLFLYLAYWIIAETHFLFTCFSSLSGGLYQAVEIFTMIFFILKRHWAYK